MCFQEVWTTSAELRRIFSQMGIRVREGAEHYAVFGRDRDILAALREREEIVVGISPPGVDARLAIASIDVLPVVLKKSNCHVAEVPRLVATSGGARIHAVNEVAVFPRRSATLMFYDIWIDGEILFGDAADGVLISTPLGSTAYARSAGGAVIRLGTRAMEIVPVNSTTRKPPVVVPLESNIRVTNIYSPSPVEIIADGVIRAPVRGEVEITADKSAKLLKIARETSPKDKSQLPPSAKFVLRAIEERGSATSTTLASVTGLSLRTVQHALKVLRERGYVEVALEAGRRVYRLKE